MNYNFHTIRGMLRFIVGHPLNRGRPVGAVWRYVSWHLASRMFPGGVVLPFVNDSRLIVRPRMHGATAAVYTGLPEYEEMSLLLHLLRPDDLFVDVGANVGIFSVLASAVSGARTLAFEPVPESCRSLLDNLRLNDVESRVELRRAAVGATSDKVRFRSDQDTNNRVLENPADSASSIEVEMVTLDQELDQRSPVMVKIDVEGWEHEVLKGAARTLRNPTLLAVVLELFGGGSRYGSNDEACHRIMLEAGFEPVHYAPETRTFHSLEPADQPGIAEYALHQESGRSSAPTRRGTPFQCSRAHPVNGRHPRAGLGALRLAAASTWRSIHA